MIKKISGLAALLGLLTVVIGAFGAHSLKEKLSPEVLQSFETGVRYMMYHVLAILFITNSGMLSEKIQNDYFCIVYCWNLILFRFHF